MIPKLNVSGCVKKVGTEKEQGDLKIGKKKQYHTH
jgi:hypothetical protein